MRYFSPVSVSTVISSLFLLSVLGGCGTSGSGGTGSDRTVWVVGNADADGYAAVLRSDDGGRTWQVPESNVTMLEGIDLHDVFAVSAETAWAVGTGQTLVYTEDGGKNWTRVDTFPDHNDSIIFYTISSPVPGEFWISGSDGAVYHTRDGAEHWDKMDPSIFKHALVQGVHAIDRLTVYAVGNSVDGGTGGFAVRSLDGGANWETVGLPENNGTLSWIGVTATDRDHVVIYGPQGACLSTADGGTSWSDCGIDMGGGGMSADINDLLMLDDSTWWAAMDYDGIFLTQNGGTGWNQQQSDGVGDMFLTGIAAADSRNAVIVGQSARVPAAGKILSTTDGGADWTQRLSTDYSLQKVAFVPTEDHNVTEEGESMFASIIKTSVDGFVGGATGDFGGFVMGLILEKIGWGTQGDTEEDKLLKSMNRTLDEIVTELDDIKNALNYIESQLELIEEKILKNVLDPTDAISYIKTVYGNFQHSFGSVKAGEGDRQAILDFVNKQVYAGDQIEYDVNRIHDAIIPPDSAKTPVLNNLTDYAEDQYAEGNGTLGDVYRSIELYTSQLVVNQLKGVNLFVEAIHVDKNDSGYCAVDEDNRTCVLAYMKEYQAQLYEMIGDPGNGQSFIYNVHRLALHHANPLPYRAGQAYFNRETEAFLQRAEFYRLVATGSEQLGPRILAFYTLDTADTAATDSFYIENPDALIGASRFECTKIARPTPGRIYDNWSGNHIVNEQVYEGYECNISDPIRPGTYEIYDSLCAVIHCTDGQPLAESTVLPEDERPEAIGRIEVARYDGNYTESADGNYTYGHTVFYRRSEWNHFSKSSRYWHAFTSDMELSETYGTLPWGIGIVGWADGEDEYKGRYELDGDFWYDGKEETKMWIDYDLKYHMVTNSYYTGAGSSEAYADVHFGIWDETENRGVALIYSKYQGGVNKQIDRYYHPKGVYSFTVKPGHHYYVYFNMKEHGISGEKDGTHSRVYLEEINYIYLHF